MNEIQIGDVINNEYELIQQLSQGSFGKVFLARRFKSGKKVAIKVEKSEMSKYNSLEKEAQILEKLQGISQIPKLIWHGTYKGCYLLVLNMLGRDLIHFQKKLKQFSVDCVFKIMYQMLGILESIHKKGIIHRDIKPENIMGKKNVDKIYLIDFGIAKNDDIDRNKHKTSFIGTTRYASIAAHQGMEQCKKDDLESLGYVAIYLITKYLPWMNIKGENRIEKIGQMKQETSLEDLCSDCPHQILKYMRYIKEFSPTKTPRYSILKELFMSQLHKAEINFDWVKLDSKRVLTKPDEKRLSNRQVKFKSDNALPKFFCIPRPAKHLNTVVQLHKDATSPSGSSNTCNYSVQETLGSQQSIKVGPTISKFNEIQLQIDRQNLLDKQIYQVSANRFSTFEGIEEDPYMPQKADYQLMERENIDLEVKYNCLHFKSVYFNFKNPIQKFSCNKKIFH